MLMLTLAPPPSPQIRDLETVAEDSPFRASGAIDHRALVTRVDREFQTGMSFRGLADCWCSQCFARFPMRLAYGVICHYTHMARVQSRNSTQPSPWSIQSVRRRQRSMGFVAELSCVPTFTPCSHHYGTEISRIIGPTTMSRDEEAPLLLLIRNKSEVKRLLVWSICLSCLLGLLACGCFCCVLAYTNTFSAPLFVLPCLAPFISGRWASTVFCSGIFAGTSGSLARMRSTR